MDWSTFLAYVWLFLINAITAAFGIPFVHLWFVRSVVTTALAVNHSYWLVSLVAATGSAIGLLPVYFLGQKAGHANKVKEFFDQPTVARFLDHPAVQKIRSWMAKRFFWLMVAINFFAPDPTSPIMAGSRGYPLRRFIPAAIIGRFLHILPFSILASYLGSRYRHFLKSLEPTLGFLTAWSLIITVLIVLHFTMRWLVRDRSAQNTK